MLLNLRHYLPVLRRKSTLSTMFQNCFEAAKLSKPPLDNSKHKGQAGRIGIVGGSLEYTGAPYFAGISALKVGADLVHIFCTQSAAPVIKSYSPELIVHPLLDVGNGVEKITPWLDRLHCVVIGPGLGREPHIFEATKGIIHACKTKSIPLVIDADGLFLLSENPNIFVDYPKPGVILTPNVVEYGRLFPDGSKKSLSDYGQNVSVLKKGAADQFENNLGMTWSNGEGGTGRRCGGQGDILSGTIAVFFHWNINSRGAELPATSERLPSGAAAAAACAAASKLVRLCNEKAFMDKGRSMLSTDMIEHIHQAFRDLFII